MLVVVMLGEVLTSHAVPGVTFQNYGNHERYRVPLVPLGAALAHRWQVVTEPGQGFLWVNSALNEYPVGSVDIGKRRRQDVSDWA